MKQADAYRDAGVDLAAQDRALAGIGELVKSTFTEGVLSGLGTFGGLFALPESLRRPVLVASADGVGTKLSVARMAGDFGTVGGDLVNHCVNDILVQGATPLFFLDYVGAGKLEGEPMRSLLRGVAEACIDNGCALLGGETAEMPGFYQPGDYELVGFIVGAVERGQILDGSAVRAGDALIGLASAGLHTNGFSLARRAFFDLGGLDLAARLPRSERTVRDVLLAPHISYLRLLEPLLGDPRLHAMAHITGGGLTDNLPRVLPSGLGAEVDVGGWQVPEEFTAIQRLADVQTEEMYRVFNMGVGMVVVVAPDAAADLIAELEAAGGQAFLLGSVQAGEGVSYGGFVPSEPCRGPSSPS
ncbi:MAG: phosphoribosylformylglycinamidine cyclo-ligase [Acidobacteria bacterium]|nr:phosphoribosylformylglycinamidine cyclo-ligase [Acidobacteriota bacterium]